MSKVTDKSSLGGLCRHFGPKNIRRSRRVQDVLNYQHTIWNQIWTNRPLPKSLPRRPEIRTQADQVRIFFWLLAVPFGTLLSHRFQDAFFSSIFLSVDDCWFPFRFNFHSVFVQFRIPFSEPVFAYVFFYWFESISGALNPQDATSYFGKTDSCLKLPFVKHMDKNKISGSISASFWDHLFGFRFQHYFTLIFYNISLFIIY